MAGEEFPETGDRPYGPKLQAYIDARDSEVAAGAGSDASEQIAVHESSPNPHPQYETSGEVDVRVAAGGVAAITAHKAEADPHPQYETAAEVTAKITAHTAAADPHTQYTLETVTVVGGTLAGSLTTPGSYYVLGSTATTANGYPASAGLPGVMTVVGAGTHRVQTFTFAAGANVNQMYVRSSADTGATWTAWVDPALFHEGKADPHPQYRMEVATTLAMPLNLDTVLAPGHYSHGYNGGNTNVPVADGGYMTVEVYSGSGAVTQRWESIVGRQFTRQKANSGAAWSVWTEYTPVSTHAAAVDPHAAAGYARKSVANVFTAGQTVSTTVAPIVRIRTDAPANAKRWDDYIDAGLGYYAMIAKSDDALTNQSVPILLYRDGHVTVGAAGVTSAFSGVSVRSGVGSPEGVVVGPVGMEYTDTAATNGAAKWVKLAGIGSVGWKVAYGDTGWRNLAQYLVNGAGQGGANMPPGGTEPIRIRRVGDTVYLIASFAVPTWVSGQAALEFPVTGFSVPFQYMPNGYGGSVPTILAGGSLRLYTTSASAGYRYQWTWLTSDAWPTTLPGTPA